ncbi:uncharacterized protein LOC143521407 [Brachyhypopomus gauderio]|uniref:uncharacterized protein LOC143521407 n=1 Tax=Brachyhypopomus gauderio TaxID=698409 RepID=UPI0040433D08
MKQCCTSLLENIYTQDRKIRCPARTLLFTTMASPSKRVPEDTETLSGYIHSVSPVRLSANNSELFNAVLQTGREDFHDTVVFSARKRNDFLQAAENGTAICLKNVKKALSFRSTSEFDVIVSHRTELTVTAVSFARRTPPPPPKTTLRDVLSMAAGKKVSLIEAKVLACDRMTDRVNIRGTERELRTCTISDGTANITLQLWEKHIDAVRAQSSYGFTYLSTRFYEGKCQLTTTLNTAVDKIPDLNVSDTQSASAEPALTTLVAAILALDIKASTLCLICNTNQQTLDERKKFHRCEKCNFLQTTSRYSKWMRGTVKIKADNEEYSLTVTNSPLAAYIAQYNLQSFTLVEELEEHFLDHKILSFTFDKQLRICELSQISPPKPPQELFTAACSVDSSPSTNATV